MPGLLFPQMTPSYALKFLINEREKPVRNGFVAPERPGFVNFVTNFAPFSEPNGGPNFYPFDPNCRYNVNVDSNGDVAERRERPVEALAVGLRGIGRGGTG